jgi:hypothetical protein
VQQTEKRSMKARRVFRETRRAPVSRSDESDRARGVVAVDLEAETCFNFN